MKKLFVFLFAILPAAAMADYDYDYDRPVKPENLPAAARQFIRTHFPDAKITLATIDREFLETTYDVIFSDGMQIEFNSKGEWKDIDCRRSFVPKSVLPAAIASFLGENFPDARVRDIDRDRHGYELTLDNRVELGFDRHGRFRGYDD
jgi:hypothetical protein